MASYKQLLIVHSGIFQTNEQGNKEEEVVYKLPAPSTYQWDLEDLSKSDAGRVESGKMYKKKIGFVRAITVTWKYLTTAEMRTILQIITTREYMDLSFLCPLYGGMTKTSVYVGNRTAPLYNGELDLWESLSVKFIERSVTNNA